MSPQIFLEFNLYVANGLNSLQIMGEQANLGIAN